MKKNVPVVVILLILAVGGYFYMKMQKPTNVMTGKKPAAAGNVFTSIKDALSKSLTLQCEFKDEKGTQTTTYIKGGAVRVVMASATDKEEPNNILMKDKKMYMWSDVSKTGFVFTVEDPGASPYPTFKVEKGLEPEKKPGFDQQESVLAQVEKYKDSCKTAVVEDNFFEVPTDVEFQDMSKFTEQFMKPSQPAGQGQDSVDYEKYLKEMMKKQEEGQ